MIYWMCKSRCQRVPLLRQVGMRYATPKWNQKKRHATGTMQVVRGFCRSAWSERTCERMWTVAFGFQWNVFHIASCIESSNSIIKSQVSTLAKRRLAGLMSLCIMFLGNINNLQRNNKVSKCHDCSCALWRQCCGLLLLDAKYFVSLRPSLAKFEAAALHEHRLNLAGPDKEVSV